MKFYVASSIKNKDVTQKLLGTLRDAQHEVTVDWTREDNIPVHERDAKLEEVREISTRDFEGILDCDVFVLLSDPAEGRSMYVEFGIALASNAKSGRPLVFVLGEQETKVFFTTILLLEEFEAWRKS